MSLKNKLAFSLLTFIATLTLWFVSKSPSNDLDFAKAFQLLPSASLKGDDLIIHNLRDFRYQPNGDIAQANYRTQRFQLSQLSNTWLGLSHFHEGGLAHVFLSFEFSAKEGSKDYLVISIEARLRQDQANYSPAVGLFRQYNKMLV